MILSRVAVTWLGAADHRQATVGVMSSVQLAQPPSVPDDPGYFSQPTHYPFFGRRLHGNLQVKPIRVAVGGVKSVSKRNAPFNERLLHGISTAVGGRNAIC